MKTTPKSESLIPAVMPHGAQWMIEPNAARQLLQFLKMQSAPQHKADFESRADESYGLYSNQDGVAIISLSGPMTKAPTSMDAGCSTVRLRRAIRAAASDEEVKSIMLLIDSPGGSAAGTADLASDVAIAKKKKPVYAFVEDCCCSAAYWVASQCTRILANSTAMVGSIGTYMVIDDWSAFFESEGIKVNVITTGPMKGAGVMGTEVTDDQISEFQTIVDDLNTQFVAGVAKGRGMSSDDVDSVGGGNVWIGKKAIKNGLVDAIATYDQAFLEAKAAGTSDDKKQAGARASCDLMAFDSEVETEPATAKTILSEASGLSLDDHTATVLDAVDGLVTRWGGTTDMRKADQRVTQTFITRLRSASDTLAACADRAKALDAEDSDKAPTNSLDWEKSKHTARLRAMRT